MGPKRPVTSTYRISFYITRLKYLFYIYFSYVIQILYLLTTWMHLLCILSLHCIHTFCVQNLFSLSGRLLGHVIEYLCRSAQVGENLVFFVETR